MEITLAEYNSNSIIFDFISQEFTPGKDKYYIKYTYDFNGNVQMAKFELTPSNDMPCARFGMGVIGITPARPGSLLLVTAPELRAQINFKIGAIDMNYCGIASATKIDESGDIGLTLDLWTGEIIHQFYGTVSNCNLKVTIDADFPIFATTWESVPLETYQVGVVNGCTSVSDDEDILTEIYSGNYDNITDAVNYTSIANTVPQNKIYFIKNQLTKNRSAVALKNYRFRIPPGAKIWFVATEHDPTGQTYNMTLHTRGLGIPPTFLWQIAGSGGAWTEGHIITPTLGSYYYGEWTDYDNGDFYKVVGGSKAGNTNIPVFASEEDGDSYGDGLIGEDASINAGDLGYDGNITTGDDLSSSDIPNPVIAGSGAGVNVWLLDKGNLNSIFSDLYTDQQTIIDDIQKGTWLWGNNPIDFIVSIYYVPFDVSNFYDTTTERVYLGHYDTGHDYTQCKESKSSGQRITLVNTTIDNVYGDFRDIDFFMYELYLPYIGFVPLDPNVYVGHTLTVEMAFDVMTHNIRYYLFSDGVVCDRVDGNVGYNIPITGTDMVNKANQNISGLTGIIDKTISSVGGAVSGGGSELGNVAGSTTDAQIMSAKVPIGGLINDFRSMAQYPKQIIRGDISASMNIYDINYVYLKITEKQSIYPPEIRQIYNNPSYVVGPISQLSGYCEIDNVQISSSATEREIEEIITLLRQGVIL